MKALQCDFDQYARHFTQDTQKYLEGTCPYIGTCLQLYKKQCNWLKFILPNVWTETTFAY